MTGRSKSKSKSRGPTEHAEQVELIKWARFNSNRLPGLELLFAIPNGGLRSKAVAGKLKAEGVLAGVPDLFLPVAKGGFHGLFIEMKAKKTPKPQPTKAQDAMLRALHNQGYLCHICWGAAAAQTSLEMYLSLP